MQAWFKKSVSFLVLSLFTVNTCFADIAGMGIEFSAKPETPQLIQIDIPAELASVEEFWEAPARPNPKMILQIQNAHTNYEAQGKIRDLMSYLNQNYGFKTIFVEGASEELNPEYLKLFPDAETNRKLWDELAKRGQITGADWFLLNDEKSGAKGVGIENAELYKKNYEALKAVYSRETETTKFSAGLESELDKLATKTLPPETRKIISEWKKFEKGHREFIPFVESLAKLAKENAEIDLRALYSQIEWPQMTRILVLQEMEKKLGAKDKEQRTKREAAETEKKQMLGWLKANGVSSELISGLERFNEKDINMNRIRASSGKMESLPRFFVEKLVEEAGPKGLKFSDYPNFALYTGYLILRYEIEPTALFEEIRKLFEKLLDSTNDQRLATIDKTPDSNAKTPRGLPDEVSPGVAQKGDLIELFRDAELVRKLLNLELSRGEWQKVISQKEALAPANLFERVKLLSPEAEGRRPEKMQFQKNDPLKNLSGLRSPALGLSDYQKQVNLAFDSALSFYDLAIKRDDVFYEKMAKAMETTDRAILMTGGFHTEGLRAIFREKEISYGTITPRLTQVEKSNLYREVMLGKSNFSGQRQPGDDQTVEIWSLLNQNGLEFDREKLSLAEIETAIRAATAGKGFDGNLVAQYLNGGLFEKENFAVIYNGRGFELIARSESHSDPLVPGPGAEGARFEIRDAVSEELASQADRLKKYLDEQIEKKSSVAAAFEISSAILGGLISIYVWAFGVEIYENAIMVSSLEEFFYSPLTQTYIATSLIFAVVFALVRKSVAAYRKSHFDTKAFVGEIQKNFHGFFNLSGHIEAVQFLALHRINYGAKKFEELVARMHAQDNLKVSNLKDRFNLALFEVAGEESGFSSGLNQWQSKLQSDKERKQARRVLQRYMKLHPKATLDFFNGRGAANFEFLMKHVGLKLEGFNVQSDLDGMDGPGFGTKLPLILAGQMDFIVDDGGQQYLISVRNKRFSKFPQVGRIAEQVPAGYVKITSENPLDKGARLLDPTGRHYVVSTAGDWKTAKARPVWGRTEIPVEGLLHDIRYDPTIAQPNKYGILFGIFVAAAMLVSLATLLWMKHLSPPKAPDIQPAPVPQEEVQPADDTNDERPTKSIKQDGDGEKKQGGKGPALIAARSESRGGQSFELDFFGRKVFIQNYRIEISKQQNKIEVRVFDAEQERENWARDYVLPPGKGKYAFVPVGDLVLKEIKPGMSIKIGRQTQENDIVLEGKGVSRNHIEIQVDKDGNVVLWDRSSNGTFDQFGNKIGKNLSIDLFASKARLENEFPEAKNGEWQPLIDAAQVKWGEPGALTADWVFQNRRFRDPATISRILDYLERKSDAVALKTGYFYVGAILNLADESNQKGLPQRLVLKEAVDLMHAVGPKNTKYFGQDELGVWWSVEGHLIAEVLKEQGVELKGEYQHLENPNPTYDEIVAYAQQLKSKRSEVRDMVEVMADLWMRENAMLKASREQSQFSKEDYRLIRGSAREVFGFLVNAFGLRGAKGLEGVDGAFDKLQFVVNREADSWIQKIQLQSEVSGSAESVVVLENSEMLPRAIAAEMGHAVHILGGLDMNDMHRGVAEAFDVLAQRLAVYASGNADWIADFEKNWAQKSKIASVVMSQLGIEAERMPVFSQGEEHAWKSAYADLVDRLKTFLNEDELSTLLDDAHYGLHHFIGVYIADEVLRYNFGNLELAAIQLGDLVKNSNSYSLKNPLILLTELAEKSRAAQYHRMSLFELWAEARKPATHFRVGRSVRLNVFAGPVDALFEAAENVARAGLFNLPASRGAALSGTELLQVLNSYRIRDIRFSSLQFEQVTQALVQPTVWGILGRLFMGAHGFQANLIQRIEYKHRSANAAMTVPNNVMRSESRFEQVVRTVKIAAVGSVGVVSGLAAAAVFFALMPAFSSLFFPVTLAGVVFLALSKALKYKQFLQTDGAAEFKSVRAWIGREMKHDLDQILRQLNLLVFFQPKSSDVLIAESRSTARSASVSAPRAEALSEARVINQIDLISDLILEINASKGKLSQPNVYDPLLGKIAVLQAGDNDLWSAAALPGIFTALQDIEMNNSGKSPSPAYDSKFRELLAQHLAEMNLWLNPRGYALTVNSENNLELRVRSEMRFKNNPTLQRFQKYLELTESDREAEAWLAGQVVLDVGAGKFGPADRLRMKGSQKAFMIGSIDSPVAKERTEQYVSEQKFQEDWHLGPKRAGNGEVRVIYSSWAFGDEVRKAYPSLWSDGAEEIYKKIASEISRVLSVDGLAYVRLGYEESKIFEDALDSSENGLILTKVNLFEAQETFPPLWIVTKQPLEQVLQKIEAEITGRSEMRTADGGLAATKDSQRAKQEFEDAVSKRELIPQRANTSGANEAVIYEGSRGKWYAKQYKNSDQARAELLSWFIYRQLDIPVAQEMFVLEVTNDAGEITGDVLLVSKMMPGDAVWDGYEDSTLAAREFVASAFTQDRDRSKPDNYRKYDGRVYALDFGSSAMFRSNGEIKGQGEDKGAILFSVEGFVDMLSIDSQHHAKSFFRKLTEDQIDRQIAFAAKKLNEDVLNQMVNAAFVEESRVKEDIWEVYKASTNELHELAKEFETAEEEAVPTIITEEVKRSALQRMLTVLRNAWINFIRFFTHRKANYGDLTEFETDSKTERVVPVSGVNLTRGDAAELITYGLLEVNRVGAKALIVNPSKLTEWNRIPWYHGFDEGKRNAESKIPLLEEMMFGSNPGLRPSIVDGNNRLTVTRSLPTAKNYIGHEGQDVILAFDPVKTRNFLTNPFTPLMNASSVAIDGENGENSRIPPSALTDDSKKYVITRFPDKTSDELAAALGVTKEWVAQVREDNWLGKLSFDNYGLTPAQSVAVVRSEMRQDKGLADVRAQSELAPELKLSPEFNLAIKNLFFLMGARALSAILLTYPTVDFLQTIVGRFNGLLFLGVFFITDQLIGSFLDSVDSWLGRKADRLILKLGSDLKIIQPGIVAFKVKAEKPIFAGDEVPEVMTPESFDSLSVRSKRELKSKYGILDVLEGESNQVVFNLSWLTYRAVVLRQFEDDSQDAAQDRSGEFNPYAVPGARSEMRFDQESLHQRFLESYGLNTGEAVRAGVDTSLKAWGTFTARWMYGLSALPVKKEDGLLALQKRIDFYLNPQNHVGDYLKKKEIADWINQKVKSYFPNATGLEPEQVVILKSSLKDQNSPHGLAIRPLGKIVFWEDQLDSQKRDLFEWTMVHESLHLIFPNVVGESFNEAVTEYLTGRILSRTPYEDGFMHNLESALAELKGEEKPHEDGPSSGYFGWFQALKELFDLFPGLESAVLEAYQTGDYGKLKITAAELSRDKLPKDFLFYVLINLENFELNGKLKEVFLFSQTVQMMLTYRHRLMELRNAMVLSDDQMDESDRDKLSRIDGVIKKIDESFYGSDGSKGLLNREFVLKYDGQPHRNPSYDQDFRRLSERFDIELFVPVVLQRSEARVEEKTVVFRPDSPAVSQAEESKEELIALLGGEKNLDIALGFLTKKSETPPLSLLRSIKMERANDSEHDVYKVEFTHQGDSYSFYVKRYKAEVLKDRAEKKSIAARSPAEAALHEEKIAKILSPIGLASEVLVLDAEQGLMIQKKGGEYLGLDVLTSPIYFQKLAFALGQMHGLGVAHGDLGKSGILHRGNILGYSSGWDAQATLIDFEFGVLRDENEALFEEERNGDFEGVLAYFKNKFPETERQRSEDENKTAFLNHFYEKGKAAAQAQIVDVGAGSVLVSAQLEDRVEEKTFNINGELLKVGVLSDGSIDVNGKRFNPNQKNLIRIGRGYKDLEVAYGTNAVSKIQAVLSFNGKNWVLFNYSPKVNIVDVTDPGSQNEIGQWQRVEFKTFRSESRAAVDSEFRKWESLWKDFRAQDAGAEVAGKTKNDSGVMMTTSPAMIADLIEKGGIKPGTKMLDVGTGNAVMALTLASLKSETVIESIEVDVKRYEMTQRFKEFIGSAWPENLALRQRDFLEEPIDSYDLIYFYYAEPKDLLQSKALAEKILEKLSNKMRPGQKFISPLFAGNVPELSDANNVALIYPNLVFDEIKIENKRAFLIQSSEKYLNVDREASVSFESAYAVFLGQPIPSEENLKADDWFAVKGEVGKFSVQQAFRKLTEIAADWNGDQSLRYGIELGASADFFIIKLTQDGVVMQEEKPAYNPEYENWALALMIHLQDKINAQKKEGSLPLTLTPTLDSEGPEDYDNPAFIELARQGFSQWKQPVDSIVIPSSPEQQEVKEEMQELITLYETKLQSSSKDRDGLYEIYYQVALLFSFAIIRGIVEAWRFTDYLKEIKTTPEVRKIFEEIVFYGGHAEKTYLRFAAVYQNEFLNMIQSKSWMDDIQILDAVRSSKYRVGLAYDSETDAKEKIRKMLGEQRQDDLVNQIYDLISKTRLTAMEKFARSEMRGGNEIAQSAREKTRARIAEMGERLTATDSKENPRDIIQEYRLAIERLGYVKNFDYRNIDELNVGADKGIILDRSVNLGGQQVQFIGLQAVGQDQGGEAKTRDFIFIRQVSGSQKRMMGYAILSEGKFEQAGRLRVAFHLFQDGQRDSGLLRSDDIYAAVLAIGKSAYPRTKEFAVNGEDQIFHKDFKSDGADMNASEQNQAWAKRAGFYATLGFDLPSTENRSKNLVSAAGVLNNFLIRRTNEKEQGEKGELWASLPNRLYGFTPRELGVLKEVTYADANDPYWVLPLAQTKPDAVGSTPVKARSEARFLNKANSEARVPTESAQRVEGNFETGNLAAVDRAVADKKVSVAAAILAGGVVALAAESTEASVLASVAAVAELMAPARSESELSSILKLDGWHGDEIGLTVETLTQNRFSKIDPKEINEILKANPGSRYAFILTDGGLVDGRWQELVGKYPKQLLVELQDSENIKNGLIKLTVRMGLQPVQLTGLQEEIEHYQPILKSILSGRDIRSIVFGSEDDLAGYHKVRIAKTVFAGQFSDIAQLPQNDVRIFEPQNNNGSIWRVRKGALKALVQIAIDIQAAAKAAISA